MNDGFRNTPRGPDMWRAACIVGLFALFGLVIFVLVLRLVFQFMLVSQTIPVP